MLETDRSAPQGGLLTVATGTFTDDQTVKTVVFERMNAHALTINALNEAGDRGPWTSAAEIEVLGDLDSFEPFQP